jgi:hypothetical protein
MRKRKPKRCTQTRWLYRHLVELVVIPFFVSVLSQWLATYLSHWLHCPRNAQRGRENSSLICSRKHATFILVLLESYPETCYDTH